MHPGAGKESNRWPAERFGEVARSLRAVGHRVAVCAGPNERSLLPRVDAGSGTELPRLPELSIHGLGGALADADLAIVNDTGVLHLAAAVGTATLGLFGPTDPAIWCPAAPRVWTLRGSDGHVATLPADRVARAAVELAAYLQEQRPRPPRRGRARADAVAAAGGFVVRIAFRAPNWLGDAVMATVSAAGAYAAPTPTPRSTC